MTTSIVPLDLLRGLLGQLRAISARPATLQRTLGLLGIRAPITAADVPGLAWASSLTKAADAVTAAVAALDGAADPATATAAVLTAVTDLQAAVAGLTHAPHSGFFDAAVLRRIATDLPELLLADAVVGNPPLAAVLRLLDVLEPAKVAVEPDGPAWQQPARRHRVSLDRLPAAMADPSGRVGSRWQWQDGKVRGDTLVSDLVDIARLLGLPAHRVAVPDSAADLVPAKQRWHRRAAMLPFLSRFAAGGATLLETGLLVSPAGSGESKDDGVLVELLTAFAPDLPVPLGRDWRLAANVTSPVGLVVKPGSVTVHGNGSDVDLTVTRTAPIVLPLPLATLTIPSVSAQVALSAAPAGLSLRLATIDDAPITLDFDPAAGSPFLADVVGGPLSVHFGCDLAWSSAGGLRLGGGMGLAVTIPLDRQLGPVRLDSVDLSLAAAGDGVRLAATAVAAAVVGPLALSVDGLGVALDVVPGNGLLPDLAVSPVLPRGVGVGLAAPGVATGGGYLFLSPETGEYSGLVDLALLGVGISSVGLIQTQDDDVPDWSAFLALFLDVPAIQLGFGFTLDGVGGLVGINRGLDPDALRAAVLDGALGTALFPEDPVADAPEVIDTFRSLFPAAPGRTAFGPVVSIGWGTPTLISAALGVVLSVPDPVTVAVVGSVASVLPYADVAVVEVHLDVGGSLDPAAATLDLSASLHDSRILGYSLSGGMALHAGFGNDPSFLFSLGGFHPGFPAPVGFPTPAPLRLGLDTGTDLRLGLECYLAITSNTVQFGARVELVAEVEGFGIEGGFHFDSLIQFSPFAMSTNAGCHVTVVAAGVDLAGVWLDGTLRGPNPWRVTGDAKFDVLGVPASIGFDEVIGRKRAEPPPPSADVLEALRTALQDDSAWSVVAAAAGPVTLADDAGDGMVLAPDGRLRVSQRLVPLGIRLDHVGAEPVADFDTFELRTGAGLTSTGDTVEYFAPAQFVDVAPGDLLSAPSFELLPSGLEFGGGPAAAGSPLTVSMAFQQRVIDSAVAQVSVPELFDPADDPRPAVRTVFGRPATTFAISGDAAPTLVAASSVVVDAETGKRAAARPTWSAAHQVRQRAGTILCPSWEVPA